MVPAGSGAIFVGWMRTFINKDLIGNIRLLHGVGRVAANSVWRRDQYRQHRHSCCDHGGHSSIEGDDPRQRALATHPSFNWNNDSHRFDLNGCPSLGNYGLVPSLSVRRRSAGRKRPNVVCVRQVYDARRRGRPSCSALALAWSDGRDEWRTTVRMVDSGHFSGVMDDNFA